MPLQKKITKLDDNLLTEGGKLKTGLNCLHNFINEKRHFIKSGVEKDILHLVKNLGRVMAKYKATYHIHLALSPQHLKQRKGKNRDKKREKRKLSACENRRKRACLIFRSLGGTSHPHPLVRTLSRTYLVFPNWKHSEKRYQKTDKACSRDLCRANCFAREAQEIVWDFCTWGWMNLQLSYRTVSKYKWFVWDSDRCWCNNVFSSIWPCNGY